MNKGEIFCTVLNIENKEKFININNVSINSKEVGKNDLFVAIRGGNNFLNEALEKGSYVVYDNKDASICQENKCRAFYVNDSVKFLQEFSARWRRNLKLKVIGITGSNGKTTVKDMIYHILSFKYKGKKTEGNYNNHIGLPFTLLRSEKDDDFIILEMGMSGFSEIDLLGRISEPDISVITNIGESHLEYLGTKENVFRAKTEIIPHTKDVLIINGDDGFLKNIGCDRLKIKKVREYPANGQGCMDSGDAAGGNGSNLEFYYGDIGFNEAGTGFTLRTFCQGDGNKEIRLRTNVIGRHNILNLSIAITVAEELGMDYKDIGEAVQDIVLTDMRFQIMEAGSTVYINDAYNASPMSMSSSLETFSEIYNGMEKIAVLGDMLELGEKEEELHAALFMDIARTRVDRVYLFGPRMAALYKEIKLNSSHEGVAGKEIRYFSEKSEIREELKKIKDNKAVLLKGSRGMRLEEIIEGF